MSKSLEQELQDNPHVPEDLLKLLERLFPNCVPNPEDSDRTIWRKVGNVEVVRHLRRMFDKQKGR